MGTNIADGRSHDGRLLRLHQRIAERLLLDPKSFLEKARQNLDHWAEIDPVGNAPWIKAWNEILTGSPTEIAATLVDTGERMRELRQSAPFAGVLSQGERLAVLRNSSVRMP